MYLYAWPIRLILTEHKVVASTVQTMLEMCVLLQRSNKRILNTHTHTFDSAAQKMYTVTNFKVGTQDLCHKFSITKSEVWSQSNPLFLSYVLNNG